jgi:hypothetical protein
MNKCDEYIVEFLSEKTVLDKKVILRFTPIGNPGKEN